MQRIGGLVIEREGEFTAQLRQGRLQTLLLVEAQEDLGIALAAEANTAGRQVGANPLEVIELTVVGHQDPRTRVRLSAQERLACPGLIQVNDREAGMAEAHSTAIDGAIAKTIGTAMLLNRGHVDQKLGINGLIRHGGEHTANSTHVRSSSDHIHHSVGAIHHAGEQRHPQEDRTPGLTEIPVVGGVIKAGTQLRASSKRVQNDCIWLVRQISGQPKGITMDLIAITHPSDCIDIDNIKPRDFTLQISGATHIESSLLQLLQLPGIEQFLGSVLGRVMYEDKLLNNLRKFGKDPQKRANGTHTTWDTNNSDSHPLSWRDLRGN